MFKKIGLTILGLIILVSPLSASGNRNCNKPVVGSTIDWSHPLSKGLVGCWLMNEGGGNVVTNIAKNKVSRASASSISWGNGRNGKVLQYQSTAYDINADIGTLSAPFTIICNLYPYDSQQRDSVAQSNLWYFFTLASLKIRFGVYHGYWDTIDSVSSYSVNKWNQVGGICYSPTIKASLIVNGKLETPISLGGTLPSSSGVVIFPRISNGFYGKLDNLYIYNRALSPQEIQTLYQDPYCFIKPPTIWSNFKAAVGAVARRIYFIN